MSGSVWMLSGYGASQLLRLGGNLILAWLLFPEAFGLMAIVNVVLHGLQMFSDIGVGPSIVQNRRGDSTDFLRTAWTIQLFRGLALWIATCLIAWPAAWFFARNDPTAWQLTMLLPVAGLASLISGFNSPRIYTLSRHLLFRKRMAMEVGSHATGVAIMIGWALLERSVWALVAGGLGTAVVKMVLTHVAINGERLRPAWDRECARELFGFGKWVFLSTALTFAAVHLDKLVLGAMLTLGELGIYAIAFAFVKVAMHVCMRMSESVLFPVLSKYRDDEIHMVDIAIRAREVVLGVGAAGCLAFAIASPIFFQTIYDPRYASAGIVAQWLTLYIWTSILMLSMNRVPLALGNSRALFQSNLLRSFGIVLAIGGYWVAAMPGFIVGLALGPLAAHVYLLRDIPLRRREMLRQSTSFTLVAGLYGFAGIAVSEFVRGGGAYMLWLATVCLMAGAPLAIAALFAFKRVRGRNDKAAHKAVLAASTG